MATTIIVLATKDVIVMGSDSLGTVVMVQSKLEFWVL